MKMEFSDSWLGGAILLFSLFLVITLGNVTYPPVKKNMSLEDEFPWTNRWDMASFFWEKKQITRYHVLNYPPPRPRMEFASSPLSPPGFLKDIFRFGNPESQPKSFICRWHPGWEVVTSWVRGRCQDIIISVRRKPPSCNQVPRNWNPCCCDWAFMDFFQTNFFWGIQSRYDVPIEKKN